MKKKKKPVQTKPHDHQKMVLTPWQKEHLAYLKEKQREAASKKSTAESGEAAAAVFKAPATIKEAPAEAEQRRFFKRKPPKPKQKKEGFVKKMRQPVYRHLAALLFVFFLLMLPCLYFISPFSRVDSIQVRGNQEVPAKEITAASGIKLDDGILSAVLRSTRVDRKLTAAYPRLKKAKVDFDLPNHVVIDVSEYQQIGWMLKNKKYYPILENCKVLSTPQADTEGDYPILEGFKDQEKVKDVLEQYVLIHDDIRKAISEIQYTPTVDNDLVITLFMNDGNQVIALLNGFGKKMNYYAQVAGQMKEKGIVDMEAGIYSYPYTMRSEEESTPSSTSSSENPQKEEENR